MGYPRWVHGDWNDGMNRIKGQSVWLSFFLYDVLNRVVKICEHLREKKEQKGENDAEERERIVRYHKMAETLKVALDAVAWDGKWYKRAFFEDGMPLRFQ